MYYELPGNDNGNVDSLNSQQLRHKYNVDYNSQEFNNGTTAFVASLGFLIILTLVTTLCVISWVKKSVSFFTRQNSSRKKVKKTVQCTRISVISDDGSEMMQQNSSSFSGGGSNNMLSTRFLPINEFRQHYKNLVADSYYRLSMEFDALKLRGGDMGSFVLPLCTEGDKGINRGKNRFVNVLPFDKSRFVLRPVLDTEGFTIPGSDYINANYVSGFYTLTADMERREYIATQGPLNSTIDDFWRMVWESGSKCIVMLTRTLDKGLKDDENDEPNILRELKKYEMFSWTRNPSSRSDFELDREKCAHYWPSSCLPKSYGDVEVEVLTERLEGFRPSCHKWIVSECKIRYQNQERDLRHYQFKTWSDFESIDPPEALVYFVREVRKYVPYPSLGKPGIPPIIVHCSAGVGRTGTFIGVDIILNQIKMKKAINIPTIVKQMRNERVWMVQTEQQYSCLYKCAMAILDESEAKGLPKMEVDHSVNVNNINSVAVASTSKKQDSLPYNGTRMTKNTSTLTRSSSSSCSSLSEDSN